MFDVQGSADGPQNRRLVRDWHNGCREYEIDRSHNQGMSAAADAIIGRFRRQVVTRRIRLPVLAESGHYGAIRIGQLAGQHLRANEKHEEHRRKAKRFGPERHSLV